MHYVTLIMVFTQDDTQLMDVDMNDGNIDMGLVIDWFDHMHYVA